ncbi:MAG: hypothetical protein ACI4UL_00065 [Muribaculaceae bacterium]
MFNTNDSKVRRLLLTGNFGLEKEMLRITEDGHLSHSPHPFPQDEPCITRDFCENQTEINTPIFKSAGEVVSNIYAHTCRISNKLHQLSPREFLWPFSNPPYINDEQDIPVAQFHGALQAKTRYRDYLSSRYGRYKMTFSGIHFNYSFSGDLLRRNYEVETGIKMEKGKETPEYRQYESGIYLVLAERLVAYGWIMVVLTAASPLLDTSFFETGRTGGDQFSGFASVRCSELGYWNAFAPVLDYSNIDAYADCIQQYVDDGWISAPSELYYPIRLKPRGENTLANLRQGGVNHIELRMIDLNPLQKEGIDEHDVKFAQLLLSWLSSTPRQQFSTADQVMANANYKNAAHFDLDGSNIVMPNGEALTIRQATLTVLQAMDQFYSSINGSDGIFDEALAVIDYQRRKVTQSADYRYAEIIRRQFGGGFVNNGLKLCAKYSALAAANV